MKKIILSVAVIAAVAAVVVGVTTAFFSDTETSTGNTFTAGSLDLKVDNTCHYDGMVCAQNDKQQYVWTLEDSQVPSSYPELVGQLCACTWISKDLAIDDLFFHYTDVKPGDNGENTIILKSVDNPAYVCAYATNVHREDVSCNEPECIAENGTWDGTTCNGTDPDKGCGAGMRGELQKYLFLTIWRDNGGTAGGNGIACNNINDGDEKILVSNIPVDGSANTGLLGNLGEVDKNGTCLGVSWNVPGDTGNIIQSDSVTGDITFYAEQVRNNSTFSCPKSPTQ